MRIISNLFVIIPLLATLCNLFLLMTFWIGATFEQK